MIEGFSRKSALTEKDTLFGRNESNIKVLVKIQNIEDRTVCSKDLRRFEIGDYVVATINRATSQTLHGTPLYITTLEEFYSSSQIDHTNKIEIVQ